MAVFKNHVRVTTFGLIKSQLVAVTVRLSHLMHRLPLRMSERSQSVGRPYRPRDTWQTLPGATRVPACLAAALGQLDTSCLGQRRSLAPVRIS